MNYTTDFETTTDPEDCRVWAYGICDIDNVNNFTYGNNIDDFMLWCKKQGNITIYFHNLKFDGEFVLYWLFRNGYTHVTKREDLETKTFTSLISHSGQFYSLEVCYKRMGKKRITTTIYDSLKIIPLKVAQIAKGFKLPIKKGNLDYNLYREVGHELTGEEVDYLQNDVEIPARALKTLFEQGLTKMTQGSNALYDYKQIIGKKNFEKWFPIPEYDYDIRQSYKGGFTYLNPRFKEVDVGKGIVLDVNSLYPSVMYYNPLPYGEGIMFEGQYAEDKIYNLYVQMFTCQFELKEDHIPTIQIKNSSLSFIPTEYLSSSNNEDVTLCLTSVDLKLFFEHYAVYNIEYHSGWKFKSTTGLFKDYIDKWNKIKVESTITKNYAMRVLAKLMLNALYGKFALNPNVQSKIPIWDGEKLHYKRGKKETREPIYIPVGTFITAWARYKTISSAQKVYDRFIYADTDSLHLVGEELPDMLEIDPTKLGAWKHESTFYRARFIRQKSYIEDILMSDDDIADVLEEEPWRIKHITVNPNSMLHITCAGMPEQCYPYVSWDNFRTGADYKGKLAMNRVKGGIVLENTPFTIKK